MHGSRLTPAALNLPPGDPAACGIAHEFNNLLTSVLGNLELLQTHVAGDPRALRLIDAAIRGVERGAGLTRRLLGAGGPAQNATRNDDPRGFAAGLPQALHATRGARRILVVDDDPAVAASTAEMLEELGHTAVAATSAQAALELLRADAAIEIVVTDYAMPGMTGGELAAEIRRSRPHLPVAIVTGYAELPGCDSALPRLMKPYRRAELAALIAGLAG